MGGKVAFDNNYRPRLWRGQDAAHIIKKAYQLCDLALPSIDDEFDVWNEKDLALPRFVESV